MPTISRYFAADLPQGLYLESQLRENNPINLSAEYRCCHFLKTKVAGRTVVTRRAAMDEVIGWLGLYNARRPSIKIETRDSEVERILGFDNVTLVITISDRSTTPAAAEVVAALKFELCAFKAKIPG